MMTGKPEPQITAGEYTAEGRRYVARWTDDRLRLHWVNSKGDVSRYAAAIVTGGIAEPTSNGAGHEAAIAAINADPARARVAAHCDDCHREITNPTSVKLRRGRTCAKKRETAAGSPASCLSPKRTAKPTGGRPGAAGPPWSRQAAPLRAAMTVGVVR